MDGLSDNLDAGLSGIAGLSSTGSVNILEGFSGIGGCGLDAGLSEVFWTELSRSPGEDSDNCMRDPGLLGIAGLSSSGLSGILEGGLPGN